MYKQERNKLQLDQSLCQEISGREASLLTGGSVIVVDQLLDVSPKLGQQSKKL